MAILHIINEQIPELISSVHVPVQLVIIETCDSMSLFLVDVGVVIQFLKANILSDFIIRLFEVNRTGRVEFSRLHETDLVLKELDLINGQFRISTQNHQIPT